jgi:D-alanine-D-alanine ligase
VRYECPAQLPDAVRARVERDALAAYRALGCRDVARIDFRLRGGTPYFLEVNPLPGLNPESSDLVILAGLVGWGHDRLVGAILDAALQRHRLAGGGRGVPARTAPSDGSRPPLASYRPPVTHGRR